MRSARFMSPNCARMLLISPSSCSAAVLQSGTLCVGVGLGAGVGGEAGAEASKLCGMDEVRGLVGVIIGRGAPDLDIREGLRPWTVGEVNMTFREEDAVAEAAMSVSESSTRICSPRAVKYSSWSMAGGGDWVLIQASGVVWCSLCVAEGCRADERMYMRSNTADTCTIRRN